MSKGKKWTYEEVKDYFEEQGCELKTPKEEYINIQQLLDFICSCGNYDKVRFVKFKDRCQRCKLCGKKKLSNAKSHTYEEVKKYVESLDYELIDKEYKNTRYKLTFKDREGYYYTSRYDNLLTGFKPSKFHKLNPYTIQNIKLWCKLNNKPFELVSDTYIDAKIKLKWKCLKLECLDIFEANWSDIQTGNGCGVCKGLQITLSNCLATKRPDLAKEWHPTLNGSLTPYDVTCGHDNKVWWLCSKCGNEWDATVGHRTDKIMGTGCPECNKSKGENKIDEILIFNNLIKIFQKDFDKLINEEKYKIIYFISQKEFDKLLGLGGKNLSYDFYLPKLNLLIEYHGMQHEKYIKGFHKSKKDFEKQIEHDRRKCEYAQIHNINLLIIWYWDFDNIKEILERELKKLI